MADLISYQSSFVTVKVQWICINYCFPVPNQHSSIFSNALLVLVFPDLRL